MSSTFLQETSRSNLKSNIQNAFLISILPSEDVVINEDVPDEEEVKLVFKKQKDNKCEGTDKLYAEHLKYAKSNKLVSAVLLLFTIIWTMMKVPETWLLSVITCLLKKGLKSIAKNYRSIFIMNTISRLLPRLIIEHLRSCYEKLIMKNQFGFRQNRYTTDASFIVEKPSDQLRRSLYISA